MSVSLTTTGRGEGGGGDLNKYGQLQEPAPETMDC